MLPEFIIGIVEPIEIALLIVAIASAIITARNVQSTILDRAALRAGGFNGSISMVANTMVWDQTMDLSKSIMLILVGVILLALPTMRGLLTPGLAWWWDMAIVCLTGIAGIRLIGSIHGAETRRLLREMLDPKWDGIDRRRRQVQPPAPTPPVIPPIGTGHTAFDREEF